MTVEELRIAILKRESNAWRSLKIALSMPEEAGINSVKSIQNLVEEESEKIKKWIQEQERNIA